MHIDTKELRSAKAGVVIDIVIVIIITVRSLRYVDEMDKYGAVCLPVFLSA
jgi:hypothetical protein